MEVAAFCQGLSDRTAAQFVAVQAKGNSSAAIRIASAANSVKSRDKLFPRSRANSTKSLQSTNRDFDDQNCDDDEREFDPDLPEDQEDCSFSKSTQDYTGRSGTCRRGTGVFRPLTPNQNFSDPNRPRNMDLACRRCGGRGHCANQCPSPAAGTEDQDAGNQADHAVAAGPTSANSRPPNLSSVTSKSHLSASMPSSPLSNIPSDIESKAREITRQVHSLIAAQLQEESLWCDS